jgi:tetratricopeptide (TPR) repeat protein
VSTVEPHVDKFALPRDVWNAFDVQWHNLVVAVDWTAARSDKRHAPLVYALSGGWLTRGGTVECRRRLQNALARVRHAPDHTRLLAKLSMVAIIQGEYAKALRYAQQALDIERQLDCPTRRARALYALGTAWHLLGNHADARARALEGIEIARQRNDPMALMNLLNLLIWVMRDSGELELATATVEELLPITQAHGSWTDLSRTLHTAGALALAQGNHDLAEARFTEALETCRSSIYQAPFSLEGLAVLAIERGQHERGLRLADYAAALRDEAGTVMGSAWQQQVNAALATATARLSPHHVANGRVSLEQAVSYALSDAKIDTATDTPTRRTDDVATTR